jgi:hypothetical protein
MKERTWLSIAIIIVMPLALWGAAALASDGGTGVTCPAGYLSTFNANKVGCTFCAEDSPTCEVFCLGAPTCDCSGAPDVDACCAETPCCYPCPESTSLECNVSSCGCEPTDCCFTRCPGAPSAAPALGAPTSTPFGVVAAALAIAGVALINRRRRLRGQ